MPENAICLGATIHSEKIAQQQEPDNRGTIPYALGTQIGDNGETFYAFIKSGTKFPCKVTKKFKTCEDDQDWFVNEILVGSATGDNSSNCHKIGTLSVKNIPQKKAGEQVVRITYEVKEDGLLHVSAEPGTTESRPNQPFNLRDIPFEILIPIFYPTE